MTHDQNNYKLTSHSHCVSTTSSKGPVRTELIVGIQLTLVHESEPALELALPELAGCQMKTIVLRK